MSELSQRKATRLIILLRSESSTFLHPNALYSPNVASPSEADPSPIVSSNGTDFDDVNGEHPHHVQEELIQRNYERSSIKVCHTDTREAATADWNQIQTTDENGNSHTPEGVEGEPPSVIHAPEGYGSFVGVHEHI